MTDLCLSSHNKLRELHVNTPAMAWDDGLATDAQRWAEHLAQIRSDASDSNRGEGVGENIYVGWGPKNTSCPEAVLNWYFIESLISYLIYFHFGN